MSAKENRVPQSNSQPRRSKLSLKKRPQENGPVLQVVKRHIDIPAPLLSYRRPMCASAEKQPMEAPKMVAKPIMSHEFTGSDAEIRTGIDAPESSKSSLIVNPELESLQTKELLLCQDLDDNKGACPACGVNISRLSILEKQVHMNKCSKQIALKVRANRKK